MTEQVFTKIFEQGFGYVLFLGTIIVVAYLFKLLMAEKDKRASDIKELGVVFTNTAKDLLNGNANLQKSVDTLTSIINTKRFK